jgi:pimeloyl-ACP methyl ester carboxylesterase
LGDSRHRWVSPVVYRREETEAVWRRIEAPMLLLLGVASEYLERLGEDGTDAAFQALIARLEIVRIPDAGHMLHIEKPELVAPVVERFLSAHRPGAG